MSNFLDFLNSSVLKVCPITGLLENNGVFVAQFSKEATQEQINAANIILANSQLQREKYEKLQQIDQDFLDEENAGYTTTYSWKLGLQMRDVMLLSSFFLLAKECNAMGLPIPELIDMEGNPRQLPIIELTPLMLSYGNFRAQMSKTYADRKKAVENATTIEELNNI